MEDERGSDVAVVPWVIPRFNDETEAAMREARDIMSGKIKAKVYSSVAEMNADIDGSDD